MKILFFALFLVGVVQSRRMYHSGVNPIKYKVCPSPKSTSTIQLVSVTPCDVQPCVLHRGGSTTFEIDFTPTADSKTLKSVVKGKIGPVWVPFPLDHTDACDACGVSCPLVAGQSYKFNFTLPVKSSFPAIQLIVSWELQGDDSSEVVCIELPVKLE